MALILAIESDKKQAARLATIARDPLHAELVIGESTEEAFKLLAGRHPDLILTSLLLSPKDETALADRMHEFDVAGWRVQTLVIPVLGGSKGRSGESGGGGLLTRLRGGKASRETSRGCDPGVFATQVAEYLERAAAERAVALEDAEAAAASAARAAEAAASEASATPVDEEAVFAASFEARETAPAADDTYISVVADSAAPDVEVQVAAVEPEPIFVRDAEPVIREPESIIREPEPVAVSELESVAVSEPEPVVIREPEPVVISTRPAATAHVVPFDILDDLDAMPDPVLVVEDEFEDNSPMLHAGAHAVEETEEEAVEIPLDEITETPARAPEPASTTILLDEPDIELPEIEIITTAPFDSDDTASVVLEEPRVELSVAAEPAIEAATPQQNVWQDIAHQNGVPAIESAETLGETADSDLVIQAEPIDLGFMAELAVFDAPVHEHVRADDAAPVVFSEPAPIAAEVPAPAVAPPAPAKPAASVPKPVAASAPKSHKKANKKAAVTPMPPLVPAPPKRPALVQQPPDALRLVWAWPRLEGAASEEDFAAFVTDQPADDRVAQLAPPAESRNGRSKNKRAHEPQTSKKKQKTAPPQDEWGFFDPEQCGFAALVAKLDELALDELGKEEPTRSRRK